MENEKIPLFSSDLAYLGRVNFLINAAMFSSMSDGKGEYYNILDNLFTQLIPRLDKEEIEKLEKMLSDARENYKPSHLKKVFRELNNLAHEKKLIMRDQDDGMGATES